MADGDDDTVIPEKGGKSKILEGPAKKRREQILVGVGIVTVVLTILILRRSSAQSAQGQQTQTQQGQSVGQGAGSYGQYLSGDSMAALNQSLYGVSQQLAQLQQEQPQQGATSLPTGTATPISAQAPSLTQIGTTGPIGAGGVPLYNGFNVGGGAPVYFGQNPGSATEGTQPNTNVYAATGTPLINPVKQY